MILACCDTNCPIDGGLSEYSAYGFWLPMIVVCFVICIAVFNDKFFDKNTENW